MKRCISVSLPHWFVCSAPLSLKLHSTATAITSHDLYLTCQQLTLLFNICLEVHGQCNLDCVLPQRRVFSQPSLIQLMERQNVIKVMI